jgi:hypothetical protein
LRNDVRIQLKRDSWVAVSQLCADGSDARALVNQRRSDTMSKRMEAREWNPQRQEQRAQPLFPQLNARRHFGDRQFVPEGARPSKEALMSAFSVLFTRRDEKTGLLVCLHSVQFLVCRRGGHVVVSRDAAPVRLYACYGTRSRSTLALWVLPIPSEANLGVGWSSDSRSPVGASAEQCVVENQNDDGTNNSD